MSADQAAKEALPTTLKEAAALLAQVPATSVLPLFRQPDFMMVAAVAFQGFRIDAHSYETPLIRKRLAEEVLKNEKFAEKLLTLSKQPAPVRPAASPAVAPSQRPSAPLTENQALEKYKAERDRLKNERDAAVAAQKQAEQQYVETRKQLLAAETARAEATRESERLKQKLERAERKTRQLETTNATLLRNAVHAPTPALAAPSAAPPPAPPVQISTLAPPDPESGFALAVRHLLKKQKAYLALSLAEDVLRDNPLDPAALDIQADALEASGRERESLPPLRQLMTVLLQRDDAARAADALARLLLRAANPNNEIKTVREFYMALGRMPASWEAVRRVWDRLSQYAPPVYKTLRDAAPRELADPLFATETKTITQDTPLPLAVGPVAGLTLSARQIVAAINRNDANLIDMLRDVVSRLDDATRSAIKTAVLLASEGDESYYKLLQTTEIRRGPVVVDASNVAWHGQEMLANGHPRLEYVLSVRKALRERGYFPITLIADANFPFVVNDKPAARRLVDEGEITLVTGGSDADEQLVREAKRLRAPLITNDYMTDWDAQQLVNKIQYVISLSDGHATLYF